MRRRRDWSSIWVVMLAADCCNASNSNEIVMEATVISPPAIVLSKLLVAAGSANTCFCKRFRSGTSHTGWARSSKYELALKARKPAMMPVGTVRNSAKAW
jgi:hypothetical protein